MSKKLDFARNFANWCLENRFAPNHAAELIRLSDRAFSAGQRYANSGTERDDKASDRARDKVEVIAKNMGLATKWPGLWPTFTPLGGGRTFYLPE